VTQEVLVKLARRLSTFEYDPNMTFRGWLRRITENALLDFFRDRHRRQTIQSEELAVLELTEDRKDLAARLEEAFDMELFELAIARVRSRIDSRRWSAWHMTAVDGISGEDVAERLTMKIATVYSARYQVQKMISAEIQALESAQMSRASHDSCGSRAE
jgi:RNA polymerase sigma-70 factor (ECF subfamily)